MGAPTLFERILELIRAFAGNRERLGEGPYRSTTIDHLKNDLELVHFIRHHGQDKEDFAIEAVRRIANNMRVQTLAMDPDLPPYVRVTALTRLDAQADNLRIMIARTDHDPAIAIVAIQTLHDKTRAWEAHGSVHDVVKLFLRGNAEA